MNMLGMLQQALEQVARRYRQLYLWGGLSVCWLIWALVGLGAWHYLYPEGATVTQGLTFLGALAVLAIVTGVLWCVIALRSVRDPHWVARRIEHRYPDLSKLLLTATEQQPASDTAWLDFLQAAVVDRALQHGRSHDWEATVPPSRLYGAHLAHIAALALLFVAVGWIVGSFQSSDASLPPQAKASSTKANKLAAPPAPTTVQVEPGDTEIERGTSLLVVARFQGTVPTEPRLVVEGLSKKPAEQGMSRSLEDPNFMGRVSDVQSAFSYHVAFGDGKSPGYRVKVFEYPQVQKVDAQLVFPEYTSLPARTEKDVRYITAVEGTRLTLLCQLNKQVAQAQLVDQEKKELALTPHKAGENVYSATLTLAQPRRFKIHLVDKAGRKNRHPVEIVINVTRNRPPVVKAILPGRDSRVSALEELALKANMKDDFGLVRYGLTYSLVGKQVQEVILHASKPGPRQAQPDHLLAFEALGAQPDQLVTYHFWAEDIGPDGKRRRTLGDMFFAEVRHFEEIFRQGEPQSREEREREQRERERREREGNQQGQGNAAERAEQMANLQKQIINGTWGLMRRENSAKPSEQLVKDATVLLQSQKKVLEQAAQLEQRLQDAQSKANLAQATQFMKEAEKLLTEASQKGSLEALKPALAAEQGAYQGLLRLRAREFEVRRGQQRQRNQRNQRSQRSARSASNSRRPSQRQLQQLQLNNERNRYETQRTARAQQQRQASNETPQQRAERERQQRENQQMANRLRELARRQTDLNQRAKELKAELEQARTQQKREELQRQLKRLAEQQRQMLRDADQLRNQMEREQNRDRLADSRQQLEQTRERIRQASEALQRGQVSRAISEGTRAERNLQNLQDQLRKRVANQFTDGMRQLQREARRLDENQRKLLEELTRLDRDPRRRLLDGNDRKKIVEGLKDQRAQLERVVEQMKKTVKEAEKSEPRLAQELFDTVRKTTEQKIDDSLRVAQRMTEEGVVKDATEAARRSQQGINQLRQGIDRASRTVLGGRTATLRQAQRELDQLAEQIDREIARNLPRKRTQGERGRPQGTQDRLARRGEQGNQQRQPGQRPGQDNAQRQPGQRPGQGNTQRQPGQQPGQGNAQRQPGQRQPGQGTTQRQPGQRPGQGNTQRQPGQRPGQGNAQRQPGQRQPGQRPGQGNAQRQPGQRPGQVRQGSTNRQGNRNPQGGGGNRRIDPNRLLEAAGGPGGPIRGNDFRDWYDRMRSAEDLLENPRLRAEATRIRDRVRGAREEFKRHSREPDWKKLQDLVSKPLNELRKRIDEEVQRRESPKSLVPIDRDPVPPEYAEGVRRYYERLGRSRR